MAERNVLATNVWSERVRKRALAFLAGYDDVIAKGVAEGRLQLPAFHGTRDVGVFSDYGGDHRESPVLTYTFLIVDFGFLEGFGQAMAQIRSDHKLGSREISFKELNSKAITAAVPRIMRAADRLPGLLFTLAVSKRAKNLLGHERAVADARKQLDEASISSWQNPFELETALRKIFTVAYWLAMLGRDGMGVFWMTDNDSLVANQSGMDDLGKLLPGALESLQSPNFRLIGLAKEFAKTETQPYFNDCLAVADLVAGSVAAAYTDRADIKHHSKKKTPAITDVLTLHGHQGVFLKKLIIGIDETDGQLDLSAMWIESTTRSREGYFSYEGAF